MTPEQFCYWLQGIAEAGNTTVQPTPQQWTIIKDHLQTVFKKVTPAYPSTQQPADLTRLISRPAPWFDPNTPPNITC